MIHVSNLYDIILVANVLLKYLELNFVLRVQIVWGKKLLRIKEFLGQKCWLSKNDEGQKFLEVKFFKGSTLLGV